MAEEKLTTIKMRKEKNVCLTANKHYSNIVHRTEGRKGCTFLNTATTQP